MENEFEKAKKFLKKIRWIDNEIDALIEDKKSYMDLATKQIGRASCRERV